MTMPRATPTWLPADSPELLPLLSLGSVVFWPAMFEVVWRAGAPLVVVEEGAMVAVDRAVVVASLKYLHVTAEGGKSDRSQLERTNLPREED